MDNQRSDIIKIKELLISGLSVKIEKTDREIKRLEKIDFAFSNLRLMVFLLIIFSLWLFVSGDRVTAVFIGVNAIIAFGGLIYYHNAVLENLQKRRAESVLANERKKRCEENIEGHKDADKFFVKEAIDHYLFNSPPLHAVPGNSYDIGGDILNDLDFYSGDANLFSLYNTAQTSPGIKKTYKYLKTPLLDPALIRNRQSAVGELAKDPEFVDKAMLALYSLRGRRFGDFISAVMTPPVLPHNVFFKWLLFSLSAAAIITLLSGYYNIFAIIYIFNFTLIALFFNKCAQLKKSFISMSVFAGPFSQLSALFYGRAFDSELLKEIAAPLCGRAEYLQIKNGPPFHKKLGVLAKIADLMLIPVPVILDALILSELLLCERIERKTAEIKNELLSFIGAMAEFEALSSLANIKIDLPEYNFADIKDAGGPRILKINGVIHPLIKYEKAVDNSLSFDEALDVAIITGSNMSGKSTFLKSSAISIILTLAGAPARVIGMELTPFIIITDIRITDSIKAGISHFYSELLRVKAVTDKLAEAKNVFAIFDELFHGTNSRERLALCRATLQYLQKSGGKFVMATHDRELTSLGDTAAAPAVRNYHFEEKMEGLESVFTYKLVNGPVMMVNAVKLAQKCGLPEEIYKKAAELSSAD
jgi:hypothetical protein